MIQVKIRKYQTGDCDAIWKLNNIEMGYKFPLPDTERKLEDLSRSSKDRIFVAVIENKIIGYVHVNDYDVIYAPHMKNIMGIAVSSEYKRRGVGKALLKEVELWAKETGADSVRLVSGAQRTSAHEFYKACGYDGGRQQLNFRKRV